MKLTRTATAAIQREMGNAPAIQSSGIKTNTVVQGQPPSLSEKDIHVTIQNSNSLVIIVAIAASILTAYFTHYFAVRRNRQRACLDTAALLHGYEEELQNGIVIMNSMDSWIDDQLKSSAATYPVNPPPQVLLPNKFWDSFKPTHEGIYELWVLGQRNTDPPYNQSAHLATHLKNCFEHINRRSENITTSLYKLWQRARSTGGYWTSLPVALNIQKNNLRPLIDGQSMTLEATRYAMKRLIEKGERAWFLPLK